MIEAIGDNICWVIPLGMLFGLFILGLCKAAARADDAMGNRS